MNTLLAAAVRHHQTGRPDAAAALYARVLALEPAHGDALHLLGLARGMLGDDAAAVRLLLRSLACGCAAAAGPLVSALGNLGMRRHRAGERKGAAACLRAALALVPGDAALWNCLGHALYGGNGAGTAFQRTLAVQPDLAEPARFLGFIHKLRQDRERAAAWLRRAVAVAPDNPIALDGLGGVLFDRGQLDGATTLFERALAVDPGLLAARYNMALVWKNLGCAGRAIARLHEIEEHHPDDAFVSRQLLWAVLCDPAQDEASRFAEHLRFAERHAAPLRVHQRPHVNSPDPDRRIRVGWLSSDFREHSVARNLEPVLAGRDRRSAEAHLYADLDRPDAMSAHLRGLADGWRDIAGLSDAEVAGMIRADGIDVLVILAGRFDNNRPLVAAARPAPVQVTFHDVATSGLDEMGYLIADPVLAPRGRTAERFSERVVRLPSFCVHAPLAGSPETGEPPVRRNGFSTFASFNNPAKHNDTVLDLWGRLLAAVPGSRLLLKYAGWYASERLRHRVLDAVARHGVEAGRIAMPGHEQPQADHLALYREVDVALDPFPFCGSTTTFEALWMGVPVVTLPCDSMVSRWSASMLTALKLPELIAASPAAYLDTAAALAGDPGRLAALRADLRGRILASPIVDQRLKARHMDRLLRALWRRWCRTAQEEGTA